MATSGLREGGRESAPPTPSESSTEEKPRTSDNDVQQLIGYQDKLPTQPQWRSSSWKLVDPQPPHFKEEEERGITQEEECLLGQEEADLTKFPLTVISVKIEDRPSESLRRLCPSGGQQLIGYQDKLSTQPQLRSSNWKQADPQPPHVKEEEEELCTIEEGECLLGTKEADLTKLPMSGVSVKAKDHEDKSPESSQLHHSPSEENKSSSSSPQHTTDSDGDHCGGTQADSLLAPLSDSEDAMSHSAEDEDRDHGQEPLSSDTDWEGDVRTHTDNKHSECSKKKTDVQQLIGCQEERPTRPWGPSFYWKQDNSQLPHVKKEEEELWTVEDGECLLGQEEDDLTKLPLTVVSVKSEDKSPQLHHSPGEERRCSSSRSPQHMTTEAEGDHCGGSQADNLLAPLSDSDDATSHSPEDEDRYDTQKPLSGDTDWDGDIRTPTDNKHSECSKKKTGKKRSTCSVCAKSFPCKSNLTQHMRTHTGEKPFICSVCGQNFSFQSGMIRHMRTHTDGQPFACSVCDKRFSDQSGMVRHMRTHTGEQPYSCSVCCKRFIRKDAMVRHMRTHTGERPFSCSVCDKRFSQKATLVSHKRTHTAEKSFSCFVCGQRFVHKAALVSHMKTHPEENPFSCPVCAQRFSQKIHVVRHMRMHTGETHFSCSVCGKRFIRKGDIARHMRTHTGEKPFGCSVCGQRFTRKLSMVSHMRMHSGEKPFGCSVCGERFSRASGVVQHMRTHTGQKPFGCSVCGKRFIRKGDRVRHMSTHTGRKPFSCSVCGKSYSCKKRLTQHTQTHNGL